MDGDEIQTKISPFTHHFGKQREEETKCACAKNSRTQIVSQPRWFIPSSPKVLERVISDFTWFSHVFLPYPTGLVNTFRRNTFKAREGKVVIHEAFIGTSHETCRQSVRQESDRPRSLWRCFSDLWQACAMKFAQNSKQKRLNGAEST